MEKIISSTIINPCGVDDKGQLHRWVGFDKTTFPFPTFYGSKTIPRLEPPSYDPPEFSTKNSKT